MHNEVKLTGCTISGIPAAEEKGVRLPPDEIDEVTNGFKTPPGEATGKFFLYQVAEIRDSIKAIRMIFCSF